MRLQVDFFEDYVTYNFYKGDEATFDDEDMFMGLLRESWDLKE